MNKATYMTYYLTTSRRDRVGGVVEEPFHRHGYNHEVHRHKSQ